MAKRELSSTLKNLKFMQKAAQKEEKSKEVEELIGNQPRPVSISEGEQIGGLKKNKHEASFLSQVVVIMEGDPHPGALKGRMSFQNFNPSIDKMNEAAENLCQPYATATTSGDPNGRISDRENGSPQIGSESSNISRPDSDSDGDHKRKQPEIESEDRYPNKSLRNSKGESDERSSPNKGKGHYKQQKREKLDWSVLRPPKAQNRRG